MFALVYIKAYLSTKWRLHPSSHLATTDTGRKLLAVGPFGGGDLSPHLTQCGQDRSLPTCQVSSWSVQPFGHNRPTLQTGQDTKYRTDRQTTVG